MSKSAFGDIDLHKLLAAEHLPAMPQSALGVLEVSRDPAAGPLEYAVPIESDPGLTAQVLRFVNSSFFGFRYEICSVRQAITLVGVRSIKNFALYSAVFSLIPNPRCGDFDVSKLWQDSLRRALFARAMGRLLGLEPAEETFAAALLQDMAVPLLAKELSEAYRRLFLVQDKAQGAVRLSELERHVFGWDHAEAAGIMARNWHLPEQFATLIEDHLDLQRCEKQTLDNPAQAAVVLSALLPAASRPGWHDFQAFRDGYARLCPRGGPEIEDLFSAVDQEYAEFAPVLQVSPGGRSLVDAFSEAMSPQECLEAGA